MPLLKKHLHLLILVLVVLALGAFAFYYTGARDAVPGIPTIPDEGTEAELPGEEPDTDSEPKSPAACAEAGGVWNPCASACPDAGPDEVCIQLCVERCEGLGAEATLPIFFSAPALSSRDNPECDEVYPETRAVSRVGEDVPWPEVALRALLAGPSESEGSLFFTSIPDGVALLSLEVDGGVAHADFSSELNQVAGSCRVIAIRAQIEETLKRFDGIDEVVISVEGNIGEALQP